MKRMSGLDASFLYTESPTLHMHTLKIGVMDVSGVPDGYSFERVKEVLGARLHLLPPFRQRVRRVPLDLHHPLWVEDASFDLDRHVRRVQVAGPGNRRQLDDVISQVASTPLDPDRPLWEVVVVEGLEDGTVGFVTKLHHSLADGVAASALLANVMSDRADDVEPPEPEAPWEPDVVPGKGRLLLDAVGDHVLAAVRLPALMRATALGLRRLRRERRATVHDLPPGVFSGPRTSFNASLTPNRCYASLSLPIDDFREIKSTFGCTVNDVVLAVVAASLRRYLDARGEVYDRPLVAAVPLSADSPGDDARLGGNRTGNLFTALRTDLDDPVERLRSMSRVTSNSKRFQNALGIDMMHQWVDYTPPKPYRWIWSYLVPKLKRPPINCIVSNVPGPREPMYIAGARLVGLYSVGPLMEGVGLNVTVWSYGDRMSFSALACPDSLPDPHEVTEGIRVAVAELLDAAAVAAGAAGYRRPR